MEVPPNHQSHWALGHFSIESHGDFNGNRCEVLPLPAPAAPAEGRYGCDLPRLMNSSSFNRG